MSLTLLPHIHHLPLNVHLYFLIHLLICYFSISFLTLPILLFYPRQMVSASLRWLWNQKCNSFFFYAIAPFLPFSLPSLILVSSHCGAFNASYHMVAESRAEVWGSFYRCVEAQLQQCASKLRVFHYANVRPCRPLHPPYSHPNPFDSFPFLLIRNHKLVGTFYRKDAIINHTAPVTLCVGVTPATRDNRVKK